MKAYITQYASLTNVVTITVAIVEGNIPAVGDLITVQGLAAPAANVTNVALTGVNINANTGIGTLTYAATTPDVQPAQATGGQARTFVPEVPEASVPNQAYQAFAIPRSARLESAAGREMALSVTYPSAPAVLKYNLQAAINNVDSEFVSLGTDIAAAGTTLFTVPAVYNFVRYKDTGSSGGASPTVIAKILT